MKIQEFRNAHEGQTCVIIGNGPSLKDTDLDQFEGMVTFGLNKIYLSDHTPTYHVSVNDLVLDQFADEMIEEMPGVIKFITHRKKDLFLGKDPEAVFINTDGKAPRFSRDMTGPVWEGHTVTFVALQLAYFMGFFRVVLVGVDHYFRSKGTPNSPVMSMGEDYDHFHPDYFGPGVEWNLPDLEKSEIAYSLAKNAYEKVGREIINCSHRTALKTFDLVQPGRINLFTEGLKHPKVSAIVSAYFAEEFMSGCIQDLKEQTLWQGRELEIVVVCQEGSKEHRTCEVFADTVDIFQLVLTEDIPTVYEAWNLGIERASGKYITNANADDRHNPIAYELMAEILYANDHIDLVYHNSYITWEPNTTWEEFTSKDRDLVGGRVKDRDGIFAWSDYSRAALNKGCFIGPQPMWRASLHQLHGGFNPEYESAGDYEFWLRIADKDNMFHISEPLGLYLAREDGKEMSDLQQNAAESIYAKIDNADEGLLCKQLAENMYQLFLGDEYVVTNHESIMGLVRHINKNEREHTVDVKPKNQGISQQPGTPRDASEEGEEMI